MMNFTEQKNKLLLREKQLADLKTMDQAAIDSLTAQIKREHQALSFQEAKAVNDARRSQWHRLVKQNESQMTVINQYAGVQFQRLAKSALPKTPVAVNSLRAFLVGGVICALGQVLINVGAANGLDFKTAAGLASAAIVVATGILTALGVYDEVGRFGGAGSMVPISGFANSVVSAAMEFKREGMVYGIGAKIFTIAGPVILYGTLTAVVLGLVRFLLG